jgi:hypothetical protein
MRLHCTMVQVAQVVQCTVQCQNSITGLNYVRYEISISYFITYAFGIYH